MITNLGFTMPPYGKLTKILFPVKNPIGDNIEDDWILLVKINKYLNV
jgi:hypothetical protein